MVADPHWVSFMYSYPNLLPLPAAEISSIRDTIARYDFERLYGMRFESVVPAGAKNVVMRSADRYMRALEQRLT
ncbi:MAG: hypothetical protein NVSMB27_05700 [Ktedonobacteraceae bacterium]